MSDQPNEGGGVTRLSFIKSSAGVAAGMAAVGVPAAAVMAEEEKGVVTKPAAPPPSEPVMAYVRDAKRGEVTVMSGTSETTYKDPVLTQRLLDAAGPTISGGGL